MLRVSVPGRYQQAVQNHSFAFSLASFVAGLLQPAPQGAPASADGRRRGGLPLLQVGLHAGSLAALTQQSNGVPKGYLRVLVFNTDSVLVDQRTVQLSQAALNNYEVLQTGFLPIGQDGYVSVYVGNESQVDVLFDDVQVEYRQGLQVQEVHYDPAGLELAGLAAPSPGIRGLNNYRFNGKEFQADLGLAWNHQDWRFFDPQLLRWHSVDPELEDNQESWTPYSFGFDNAVRYADANGRNPGGGITMPIYQPQWAIYEVGLGVMQTLTNAVGTVVDKFHALTTITTTTETSSRGGTVLGIGGKMTTSIEKKEETTYQPALKNWLALPGNSNSPSTSPVRVSSASKVSTVVKVEGSGKYRKILDVKGSGAVKTETNTGTKTGVLEASLGLNVSKGPVGGTGSATLSAERNNKGQSKVKVGAKFDVQATEKTKVSHAVGIGFSF